MSSVASLFLLPIRMFKATITVAISAIECSVRHAKYLSGGLHFQFFALNGVHNASRERLLPELLAASRRQVIVHLHDVSELFRDRWIRGVGIRGCGRRCGKIKSHLDSSCLAKQQVSHKLINPHISYKIINPQLDKIRDV